MKNVVPRRGGESASKCDETIRGHVLCSFLALVLRAELQRRSAQLRGAGAAPEWADIVRDLDALTQTEIEVDGKLFVVRSQARGAAVKAFRACGVALPALGRACRGVALASRAL